MITIKVSELIAALEEVKSQAGDLPVVMSRDEEGNGYGTISMNNSFAWNNGLAIIWPFQELYELEEIEGFIPDGDEG